VNSAYRNGAPADRFLVFGLYADARLRNNTYTTCFFTPEPSSGFLFGLGVAMLARWRRRS